jgi:hypothetical protein
MAWQEIFNAISKNYRPALMRRVQRLKFQAGAQKTIQDKYILPIYKRSYQVNCA